MNYQAIDIGASGLVEIEVDPAWKDLKVEAKVEEKDCGCSSCSCTPVEKFVEKLQNQ